jgi:hypothetical protein
MRDHVMGRLSIVAEAHANTAHDVESSHRP